jgi:hypothetical protein
MTDEQTANRHDVRGALVAQDGTVHYDDPEQRHVCVSRELFEQMVADSLAVATLRADLAAATEALERVADGEWVEGDPLDVRDAARATLAKLKGGTG